jgi:hypothetical protein
MNAQVDARDLTPMFERLLEALETALDLASRADRDDRLTEIADHFWPARSNLAAIWPALRARLGTSGCIRDGKPR